MIKEIKEFNTRNKKILTSLLLISVVISTNYFLFSLVRRYIEHNRNLPFGTLENSFDAPKSKDRESIVENLSIDFLDEPKLVNKKFDFFKQIEGRDKSYGPEDPDDECFDNVYVTGKVKSGWVDRNNLVGYTSYLLDGHVRILHNDEKDITYFLTDIGPPMFSFEELKPGVNMYLETLVPQEVFVDPIFKTGNVVMSDKGYKYQVLKGYLYLQEELKVVDTVEGHNIYVKALEGESLFYVRNKDGTYSGLRYEIPFLEKCDNLISCPVTFRTNKGDEFTGTYSLINFPINCKNKYTISTLPISNFEKVGVLSNGDFIYQEKNRESVRDIYNEYTSVSQNLLNSIIEDDEAHYTFDQFEKNYPSIFWLSPFGGFVELQRDDFLPARACHDISFFN